MTRIPIEGDVDRLAYASWKNASNEADRLIHSGFGHSIGRRKTYSLYDVGQIGTSEVEPLREEVKTTPQGGYTLEAVLASGEVGEEIAKVIFDARELAKKTSPRKSRRKSPSK